MDISELGTVVHALGIPLTQKQISSICQSNSQSSSFDYNFLLQVLRDNPKPGKEDARNQLKNAFHTFDKEMKGWIAVDELRHIVTSLGEKLTEEEADELIKIADPNNIGKCEYDKFIERLISY